MGQNTSSAARLEARISRDLHITLKRAAEIQNRTVTDFVISVVQEAAKNVIEEAEIIKLSIADQETFAKNILIPPKMPPPLKRAFARHVGTPHG